MSKRINLKNQRFGRLTVKSFAEIRNRRAYWLCVCDCGNKKTVRGAHLRHGSIKSCGCLSKEITARLGRQQRGIKRAKITGNKMQCSKCGEFKLFKEFKNNKNQCSTCTKEIKKKYFQQPEVKEKIRQRYQQPEAKEKVRQRCQQPEVKERNRCLKKISNKKRVDELVDSYVGNLIINKHFKNIGLKTQNIAPEIIELKRDQLLLYRINNKIKRRIENGIIPETTQKNGRIRRATGKR